MYELRVREHFDAAHYIKDYKGKCSREHGHRWEVEVVIEGRKLDKRNILIDFKEVKKTLEVLLEKVDHYQLNEVFQEEPNITAEYLARWFHDCLKEKLQILSVEVWESPECSVKYSESQPVGSIVRIG